MQLLNRNNFHLGPAKPGDGPTPDGGRFSRSPSGTPIGTMAPTANGVEIVSHQRAPAPLRVAVRALSPLSATAANSSRGGGESRPARLGQAGTAREAPRSPTGRLASPVQVDGAEVASGPRETITPGPAAMRDALLRCIDAMADGFGRDWEREEIDRRARAWEQRHG